MQSKWFLQVQVENSKLIFNLRFNLCLCFYHYSSLERRCRNIEHNNSPYDLVLATLKIYSDSITADIVNKVSGHLLTLKLEGVKVM